MLHDNIHYWASGHWQCEVDITHHNELRSGGLSPIKACSKWYVCTSVWMCDGKQAIAAGLYEKYDYIMYALQLQARILSSLPNIPTHSSKRSLFIAIIIIDTKRIFGALLFRGKNSTMPFVFHFPYIRFSSSVKMWKLTGNLRHTRKKLWESSSPIITYIFLEGCWLMIITLSLNMQRHMPNKL